MGSISRFNLTEIITTYNIHSFIETGTGLGESLIYALSYDFKKFYSIEINEELYNKVKNEINNEKCLILNNSSEEGLEFILTNFNVKNVLFWLDAHFPGADFGLSSYHETKDEKLRIPLESELRKICNIRDISKDFFIIDDLRIYEDGPFHGGNWENRKILGGDNINFIYELFEKTHIIEKDFRDQGYIIVKPKINN